MSISSKITRQSEIKIKIKLPDYFHAPLSSVLKKTNMSIQELFDFGLLSYHPSLFLESKIDQVKIPMLLRKGENRLFTSQNIEVLIKKYQKLVNDDNLR